MQKLHGELKNTPGDVKLLLVPCSVNPGLNKEETLSVQDKVLPCNISEGVQPQSHTGGLTVMAYVLSKEGFPLMPCSTVKAKHLLKEKKAHVVKRIPFTIQLNFICENKTQDVILGIDPGYKNIGFSCVSDKKELMSGELVLDDKTSDRIKEKKMYRKLRRSRLWYREPRFNNRKRKGVWLSPSHQRKYDTHINLIERKLKSILPITKTIVENCNFDIQKLENPDIEGIGYQQGELYQYENIRSYLMEREEGKCQLCKKGFSRGNPSHIHHNKPRSESGSNRVKNLVLLHKRGCHRKIHDKNIKLSPAREYKGSTFMNIIKNKFIEDIKDIEFTYGYITKIKRMELGLEKSHVNDAFIIAGGERKERVRSYIIEQRHRHNRVFQLNRKGHKPSIKTHIYKIQPKDKIWVSGKIYKVVGMKNKGLYVKVEGMKKDIPIRNIDKIYKYGSLVWN